MSNAILTRPTSLLVEDVRTVPTSTAVGSYVDTDGVRRAPRVVGTYTGTATAVGSYTGRRPGSVGSYVRSER